MRTTLLILAFCLGTSSLFAQGTTETISQGTVLTLSSPVGHNYKHIDFPRRNFIIKRGAVADYNSLIGMEIIVKEMVTGTDGSTKAILERKDGRPFFRFYPTVEANLEQALAVGELKS
ncbi:hypothetical protein [Sediminicola sp. 1XM1-17]|uniref:hypothetical protein n=1 Tax=Sediminicola sp. 1XM1-17 TaxID=3127702 RepID=UPI00307874EE